MSWQSLREAIRDYIYNSHKQEERDQHKKGVCERGREWQSDRVTEWKESWRRVDMVLFKIKDKKGPTEGFPPVWEVISSEKEWSRRLFRKVFGFGLLLFWKVVKFGVWFLSVLHFLVCVATNYGVVSINLTGNEWSINEGWKNLVETFLLRQCSGPNHMVGRSFTSKP